MRTPKYLQHVLIGATAVLFAGARFSTGDEPATPVSEAAAAIVNVAPATKFVTAAVAPASTVEGKTDAALAALRDRVKPLSASRALEDAFRSYFAYKAEHPGKVKKPYLYFVDYGLSNRTPRGWLFDMDELTVVEGPFMVAHGRGSSGAADGVPTRFSNRHGSAATSLGLYLAQELYNFSGKAGGRYYKSIGLRMQGLSEGFNDNARARGVVAHGAPYVTKSRAGRSEGCPAVEEPRAQRILPMLANGGMVFLFAPNDQWLASDQWVAGGSLDEERGRRNG